MPELVYLCLQATREGQASHAHVREMIAGLERLDWRVTLFEPAYADETRRPSTLRRLREFVTVQVRLWRSWRRADLVYVRWHFATILTAFAARLAGKPVIQEVNGSYEDLLLAWPATRRAATLFRLLQRVQLRRADAVVVVTDELARWVRSEGAHGLVAVVPNGANDELFTPEAQPMPELERPYVAFVGSLAPWQGLDTILAATASPNWPAGVELVIAGSGQMESQVRAAAAPGVRLLGDVAYRRVPSVLAGAVAALCCSRPRDVGVDGLGTGITPLKLFEAMACGTAVVATDQPGQAEVVLTAGAGLIVAPDDAEALARAVAWMATHPDERAAMGRRGRIAIERTHSWRRRAEATARVLERVARTRRG